MNVEMEQRTSGSLENVDDQVHSLAVAVEATVLGPPGETAVVPFYPLIEDPLSIGETYGKRRSQKFHARARIQISQTFRDEFPKDS